MGTGYVIEHCISFFHKKRKTDAYRIYVTDALRLITENTAKIVGRFAGEASYLQVRYAELIEPTKKEKTANEIIDNIREKLST